ncbi:hypothetical protein [Pedobacter steynii]|uniref:Uncharacterized protein n=1 Tax=Pedobacter steynii TaxID=430522 RepID=A0A1D7QE71_9SPHI|nr:hypothetical protein [Pedobacter steynii]AOM76981.1 hypothetical protein BFS30_07230 [Pedobacter steynii]
MRLYEILETIRQEINHIGQEELSFELEDIHKDLILKQPDKVDGDLLKGEHFLFEYIGHLPEIRI